MQKGGHLVESKQRRLGAGRFGKVGHNTHVRTNILSIFQPLSAEIGHPGAGAFAVAWEKVHVQYGNKFPFGIKNFVGFYVGMINRNRFVFFQFQSIHFFGQVKNPINPFL